MTRARAALPAVVLTVLMGALTLAAPAGAAPKLLTFKAGPFPVGAYSVRLGHDWGTIPTPKRDGWITRMEADVVDVKTGKVVPIKRIMLHHIVFWNLGPDYKGRVAFYGDGEERAKMILPPGYGYRVRKGDKWGFVWMLMNHRWRADSVYIRYRVWFDAAPKQEVIPMAWDASHGRQGLVFDVPGTGRPGAQDVRTSEYRARVAGRLVAGLGHVHGGATDLSLGRPECASTGRAIYRSRPTWGLPSNAFYQVRPVLHEPGPINMSQFSSRAGIPIAKGELLRMTSRYDDTRPHTRAMGLMLAYLHPDPSVTKPCGARPADYRVLRTSTPGRARTPRIHVNLYDYSNTGRVQRVAGPGSAWTRLAGDAQTTVFDYGFRAGNLSVPQGATVRWRFGGPSIHNVTVASGPEGFSSDRLGAGGVFEKTLTRPGTYSFFCELHPVGMIQRIVVRPAGR